MKTIANVIILAAIAAVMAPAQWLNYPTSSVPRLPDGSVTGYKAVAQLNGDQVYLNSSFWEATPKRSYDGFA
jgi:hypothetical protein